MGLGLLALGWSKENQAQPRIREPVLWSDLVNTYNAETTIDAIDPSKYEMNQPLVTQKLIKTYFHPDCLHIAERVDVLFHCLLSSLSHLTAERRRCAAAWTSSPASQTVTKRTN